MRALQKPRELIWEYKLCGRNTRMADDNSLFIAVSCGEVEPKEIDKGDEISHHSLSCVDSALMND